MPPQMKIAFLLVQFTFYFCSGLITQVVPQVVLSSIATERFCLDNKTSQFNIDKGSLSNKTQTLDLSFGAIACTCAQWSESKLEKKQNKEYIFLEPSNNKLKNADDLFDGIHLPVRILVTGRFYTKKGFPKNYRPAKGAPSPAKVFKYTRLKVIRPGLNP